MSAPQTPRPYPEWRPQAGYRAEDAAYTFGYHLMEHCRKEALKSVADAALPTNAEERRQQLTQAVDTALHNVMDLLEGFFPTDAGPDHTAEYVLSVCIRENESEDDRIIERVDISPGLDLPIGYWKFVEGGFR